MNFNRVVLAGHLTRDIEGRQTPDGTSLGKFGLAINRKWKDQSGNAKEEACYVDCVAWGKVAETLQKFVGKGDPLFVEGRLSFSSWEAKDGSKRNKLEVVVESFQFLGGGGGQQQRENKPAAHDSIPF